MPSVPNLEMFTRVGFAARGILYLVIGYLALRFQRAESTAGALEYVAGGFGSLLILVMALGLLGYGVWRLSEAVVDTEAKGTGAKGTAARLGGAVSGLVHIVLAFLALNHAIGQAGVQSGGNEASQGAATALTLPGGHFLVIAAGAALIGTGIWQLVNATIGDFLKYLDQRAAHQRWVRWLGRAGYAARGIVFLNIGWSLLQAGESSEATQADGMGQAIGSLSGTMYLAVATGFVLFGLFSFVEARHRRINDPEVLHRLERIARGRD